MSHFTKIKTRIVDKEYLKKALKDIGFDYKEGDLSIRSYQEITEKIDIKVRKGSRDLNLGFRKSGNFYEVIADWWSFQDIIDQEQFMQQLTQRYAYNTTITKLEEQGFSLVSEEKERGERIHLVLRRFA